MAAGRKTGGRTKGTPNADKTELLEAIRVAVRDKKYHPVVQLALVATNEEVVTRVLKLPSGKEIPIEVPRISDELKVTAAKEVAQYVSPKLKAIEHTAGEDGLGLNLHLNIGPPRKGNGAGR